MLHHVPDHAAEQMRDRVVARPVLAWRIPKPPIACRPQLAGTHAATASWVVLMVAPPKVIGPAFTAMIASSRTAGPQISRIGVGPHTASIGATPERPVVVSAARLMG